MSWPNSQRDVSVLAGGADDSNADNGEPHFVAEEVAKRGVIEPVHRGPLTRVLVQERPPLPQRRCDVALSVSREHAPSRARHASRATR